MKFQYRNECEKSYFIETFSNSDEIEGDKNLKKIVYFSFKWIVLYRIAVPTTKLLRNRKIDNCNQIINHHG